MSNFGRNLALWVIIALLLVVLFNLFQPGVNHTNSTQIAYSDFITEVNGGRVRDVVIQGRTVSGPTQRRPDLPDIYAGRPGSGQDPHRQERAGDRQAGRQ